MSATRFGMHTDIPLTQESLDYLFWASNAADLPRWYRRLAKAETRRRQGHHEPTRPTTGPIDGDVAAQIVEAGRKALALKFHPDRGGDLHAMQVVNATADKMLAGLPRRRRAA